MYTHMQLSILILSASCISADPIRSTGSVMFASTSSNGITTNSATVNPMTAISTINSTFPKYVNSTTSSQKIVNSIITSSTSPTNSTDIASTNFFTNNGLTTTLPNSNITYNGSSATPVFKSFSGKTSRTNNTATTGFESSTRTTMNTSTITGVVLSNETTGTVTLSSDGKIYNISATTTQVATFPDVVQCDVTQEMCERYAKSATTAWHITCYKYGERVRLCSSICSIKKREPKCADYCPDYKAACIRRTTTLEPTALPKDRFPDVLQCDVTQDVCKRYADSKTTPWNITCFADRRLEEITIRLCSSICLSENDGKRVKCSENCPDFRTQCVEDTTQPELPSTSMATTAEAKNAFPYVLQCDVTQDMCERYAYSKTSAWNITCFTDRRLEETTIRLCSSICLSEDNDGKRVKCSEVCPDYLKMCPHPSIDVPTISAVTSTTPTTTMMIRKQLSNRVITTTAVSVPVSLILAVIVVSVVICVIRRWRNLWEYDLSKEDPNEGASTMTSTTTIASTRHERPTTLDIPLLALGRNTASSPTESDPMVFSTEISLSPPVSPQEIADFGRGYNSSHLSRFHSENNLLESP